MVAISNSNGSRTRQKGSSSPFISQSTIIRFSQCFLCFYLGAIWGSSTGDEYCRSALQACSEGSCAQAIEEFRKQPGNNMPVEAVGLAMPSIRAAGREGKSGNRFPSSIGRMAHGMARIAREEFAAQYDTGIALDSNHRLNSEVLMIYNSEQTLPTQSNDVKRAIRENGEIPLLGAQDAAQNCETLHVILTDVTHNRRQCIAIMGQYESYHVQKFMRVPENGGALDMKQPLRLVSRGYQSNGKQQFTAPNKFNVKKNWESFSNYVSHLDKVLKQLKPVADKVAKNNTIIIMTCNHGQSELLMNFACSARARGLSLDNILLFPTDKETMDLATGLGITTFYDELNFGKMPTQAAKRYGDKNFVAMMFAKVYCVHMVSMLGYDFLFQDVDIVWYRNPLEYFQDAANPYHSFDMYFQDDGARSTRYAPYSANSGFYFVRNNRRTQYFFHSLLTNGDLIYMSDSHQQALIATMTEHTSLYGLRVKILSRDEDAFPGGYHYHRRKDFMKKFINGETDTYMFHMSWTHDKSDKLKFFRQLGDWFVKDECIGKTAHDMMPGGFALNAPNTQLVAPCCSAEPIISCHYQDKPSKVPCPQAPFIDKKERSWWS